MAQRVIHQHAGEHRLRDRRRANAHARVVAARGLYRGRFALAVDRAAWQADARGRLERDPVRAELREMPANLDPVTLAQPLLGDRAGGDADRRLAGGGAAAAAIVAQAVFLPVGVIGVPGPEGVGERAVILAPLVFVPDEKADRRAGRP